MNEYKSIGYEKEATCEIGKRLQAIGFELYNTGGNCYVWGKRVGDFIYLVSDKHGDIPTKTDSLLTIGQHDKNLEWLDNDSAGYSIRDIEKQGFFETYKQ